MPLSAETNQPSGTPEGEIGGPQIALAVDHVDWHSKQLSAAFAKLGVKAVPTHLAACGFDTRKPSGLALQGFGARLPDAVLVRAIGAGTFEAVTTRLSILHALGDQGIMVSNSARIVEICVDKAATSFYIAKANIPTPPTWTMQTLASARAIVRREAPKGALVLKPLFGSQGAGLKLIHAESDLPDHDDAQGVYYLQRYIGVEKDGFRDIRVLVSAGEVVAAMSRHARHWITNVKLGAKPEPIEIDAETRELALRSAEAVGAHFCGVDLLRGPDGRLMVIEVNSMPGWRGLQSVTGFSIAERLAADMLARLKSERPGLIAAATP